MAISDPPRTTPPGPGRDDGASWIRLWPWIVGLAAVAAAVWLGVAILDRTGPPVPDPGARPAAETPASDTAAGGEATVGEPVTGAVAEEVMARTAEMRAAVRRYESGCPVRLEPAAGPGTGALVAECIRLLAAAIDAVVASDTVGAVVIEERLAGFRERVRQLRTSPPGEGRSAATGAVLTSAAEVLATIQRERYPRSVEVDGALDELRQTARDVTAPPSLAAQQDRLGVYFRRAGALLGAMARPGDPGPGASD